MKIYQIVMVSVIALSGCTDVRDTYQKLRENFSQPNELKEQSEAEVEPAIVTGTPPPPKNASSVEEFDTTTASARAEAVKEAEKSNGAKYLGQTIASLGPPSEPGIWMKTPLVKSAVKGRVDYPAKGTSVVVELVPLDASQGAGSQISLAAMRLIEADLTGLPEVKVYQLAE